MTVVLIGCAGLSTEPVSRLLTRCRVRQTLRQRLCRDDGCIAAPVGGVIVMIVARRGNAVVEFALAGTMMLTFVAGMINVGFGIYESMQVQHAAAVGAQYAAKHGWDQAGITAAVIGAASISGVAASPAPIQFCGCLSGRRVVASGCAATCLGGAPPGLYVQVNASLAHQQLVPYVAFGVPDRLTRQSLIRLR